MFYSAKDNAFLDPSLMESYVSAESWPDDAIEVEDSVFEEFALNEAPDGKQRTANSNGLPAWEDIPPPTDEEKAEIERDWRDSELVTVVDEQSKPLRWKELDNTQQNDIEVYRRTLLDYPQQEGFPNIDRPTRPEWVN